MKIFKLSSIAWNTIFLRSRLPIFVIFSEIICRFTRFFNEIRDFLRDLLKNRDIFPKFYDEISDFILRFLDKIRD